jgi:hypothetical protein
VGKVVVIHCNIANFTKENVKERKRLIQWWDEAELVASHPTFPQPPIQPYKDEG